MTRSAVKQNKRKLLQLAFRVVHVKNVIVTIIQTEWFCRIQFPSVKANN